MTTYTYFRTRCKMRHDFADMIQVRYRHSDDEVYDTWVSGKEIVQRLRSDSAERRLRALRDLDVDELRAARDALPEQAKRRLGGWLRDRLGDGVEDLVGGNIIGDSLAAAARGEGSTDQPGERREREKERWTTLLHDPIFREAALELAWMNLRGSFPDADTGEEPEDWI